MQLHTAGCRVNARSWVIELLVSIAYLWLYVPVLVRGLAVMVNLGTSSSFSELIYTWTELRTFALS